MFRRSVATVAAGALLGLAACGDGTAPTVAEVTGVYAATTFRTTTATVTTDQLAMGGSLSLALLASGDAQGQVVQPFVADGGGTLKENVRGTWTLRGSTVALALDTDSFLSQLSLSAADSGRLSGSRSVGGTSYELVLERTSAQ